VWLAGGQSNMELELRNCSTGKDSLENDDTPNVRFYYTMKKTIADDSFFESEKQMVWNDFSNKESAQYWSAVGYYFAKELSERLGLTVGIIGCNWGGSSASAWMKREYADGETAVYFDDYDSATAGKSEQQLKQDYLDYQAYHNEWERKSAEYYSNTPNPTWDGCLAYCGENKYPGPPSPLNPMSPGVLHKSMIERIAPYTMTGVIWYQGESDDHRPGMYYKLLNQMIRNWRDDWNDDELFFDSMKVFGNNNPLHLEVGCGKGSFILELARRNPDINYVAVEKTPNVLVTGAEALMESGIKNVRFCLGQAEYLEHLFRPHTVERLYLNFSCPFPKETYARHRLTHTRFLEIYKQVMKPGSEIHQKTDNQRLFEFSIEHFSKNGFAMKNVSLDLHNSGFEGNIMTEYEKRFTELGHPIYRLEAVVPE